MKTPRLVLLESPAWRVELIPEWGASLLSVQFRHGAVWRPVGRPAAAQARESGDRLALTAWPLVPYSNRIPGGLLRARFDGADAAIPLAPTDPRFPMPIHGTGWLRQWEVMASRPSRCRMALVEQPSLWPWAFRAEHEIAVDGDQLHVEISIRNEAEVDVPCGIGWHPYVARTPRATLRAAFQWCDHSDPHTPQFDPVRRPAGLEWDGQHETPLADLAPIDNGFGGWDGRACLSWPEWNLALDIRAGGALERHCVVYLPSGADFICIEPVSHANFAFGAPAFRAQAEGVVRLASGETLRGDLTLRVVPLPSGKT